MKFEIELLALLLLDLISCGFPEEQTEKRVNAAWPGRLEDSKWLNDISLHIQDYELSGKTTKKEIVRWKG